MRDEIDLDIDWGSEVINKNYDPSPFESGSIKDEMYSDSNGTTRVLGRDHGL